MVRFFLKILMKQRIISRPMSPGFKLPGRAEKELVAPPTPLEEAVQNLRQALGRLKAESHREPHPAFGPFTRDEWEQLHCRHCELHLSFLVPS